MNKYINKSIDWTFYLLFFVTPFVFFPNTSELFEFNKIVFVYFASLLIATLWLTRMILERRIVFVRSALDAPLIFFVFAILASTLTSTDIHTSIFGYYGRWNGGLTSIITFAFLYWAYVSNMDAKSTKNSLLALITSATIISVLAILEHYGKNFTCVYALSFKEGIAYLPGNASAYLNSNCWHQDVSAKVFATLGQPNWLAAFLAAIIPLTWANLASTRSDSIREIIFKHAKYAAISTVLFVAILFTGSRSGFIAATAAFAVFWGMLLFNGIRSKLASIKTNALVIGILFLIFASITYIFGTPKAPRIDTPSETIAVKEGDVEIDNNIVVNTTDSVTLRLFVWKTALNIASDNLILGTGPETFATTFPQYKPIIHNTTSEWDFIYNKAHNEYLNYIANTGIVGTIAYLLLIVSTLYVFINESKLFKKQKSISERQITIFALASGYVSLLITNFFGFSVVTTSLLFALIPGVTITLRTKPQKAKHSKISINQWVAIFTIIITGAIVARSLTKYWLADYNYTKGRSLVASGNYTAGRNYLTQAIELNGDEADFWSEISTASANMAALANETDESEIASLLTKSSLDESDTAIALSPNSRHLKQKAINQIKLSAIDLTHLDDAVETLKLAVEAAPTDAKIMYNLGLAQLRVDEGEDAKETFIKTVEIKPNYKEAHYALALSYIEDGEDEKAAAQLKYILENLDPNHTLTLNKLQELGY